jgi:hypothetical protein
MYMLAGLGVAGALYLGSPNRGLLDRAFQTATALLFWPLYLPGLLASRGASAPVISEAAPRPDDMSVAIAQVDAELEAALDSLDGWAEGVLTRERGRIRELRQAWKTQAERIREMDRLLARPVPVDLPGFTGEETAGANERLRHSQRARQQNLERLRQVRRRAHDDLLGTLAWVRELVSMIHLAKFTGAPASRAEELVAQIAAAVEVLSEVTWMETGCSTVGEAS